MIHLIDVCKSYRTKSGDRVILHPTTLTIPTDRAVAILGRNGAGKSTLLRMLSGMEPPDFGSIEKRASLSWPIGAGGIDAKMTGRQNTRFIAGLCGVDKGYAVDFVETFAELGPYMDEQVRVYSAGMRSRLSFGISLAVEFDCYLVDEGIGAGDRWFREKCLSAFEERRRRSGLLMVSHNPSTVKSYCEMGLVLYKGHLVGFSNLGDAIRFYENAN